MNGYVRGLDGSGTSQDQAVLGVGVGRLRAPHPGGHELRHGHADLRPRGLRETAGEASLLVDPTDPAPIAAGLAHLLDEVGFRRNPGEQGLLHPCGSPGAGRPQARWNSIPPARRAEAARHPRRSPSCRPFTRRRPPWRQ